VPHILRCCSFPALQLEDEVSTALRLMGQHLSGCASHLWRPGQTNLQALPSHLQGLHPLLLPSAQAAQPGVVAPGLLDRDFGAAVVGGHGLLSRGAGRTVVASGLPKPCVVATIDRCFVIRAETLGLSLDLCWLLHWLSHAVVGAMCAVTRAVQVSPRQVYIAAMDWFEHLSRPPSDTNTHPKSCFQRCGSTSTAGSGRSELHKNTFYGPDASECCVVVVDVCCPPVVSGTSRGCPAQQHVVGTKVGSCHHQATQQHVVGTKVGSCHHQAPSSEHP
jgi:hypothetical protein